jgi:hypothetical protein
MVARSPGRPVARSPGPAAGEGHARHVAARSRLREVPLIMVGRRSAGSTPGEGHARHVPASSRLLHVPPIDDTGPPDR